MKFDITCNTDDRYAQHCSAMLCSLFENNKEYEFHVHLLTNNLSSDIRQHFVELSRKYNNLITIYDIDDSRLDGVKFRKNRPLTKAAYFRVLLSSVIDKSIEKILYLDCDMIVLGDVSELFLIELDNYALAAVEDAMPNTYLHRNQLHMQYGEPAFCSGFMMINLKYWRKHKSEDKLIEYSKRDRKVVYMHDQDSLNYVFKGQWFHLAPKWNKNAMAISIVDSKAKYFDKYEFTFEPKIIHYAGEEKPWFNVWFPNKKVYDKYLYLSKYPNPSFTKISFTKRFHIWSNVIRYYINRYIHPIIPEIIEMFLKDIFMILQLCLSIFQPQKLKSLFLDRWLNKYKNS